MFHFFLLFIFHLLLWHNLRIIKAHGAGQQNVKGKTYILAALVALVTTLLSESVIRTFKLSSFEASELVV